MNKINFVFTLLLVAQYSYSIALTKTNNNIKTQVPFDKAVSVMNGQFFGYGIIDTLVNNMNLDPCADDNFDMAALDYAIYMTFQPMAVLASNVFSNSSQVLGSNICQTNIQSVNDYFEQQFDNQTGTSPQNVIDTFGPLVQPILDFHNAFMGFLSGPGFVKVERELSCIAKNTGITPGTATAIKNFFFVINNMKARMQAGKIGEVAAICAAGLLCSTNQFRFALNNLVQAYWLPAPRFYTFAGKFVGGMVLTISNIPNILILN